MSKIKLVFTALFILLLGIFLRFYNLNVLPIFADEAIYVRWAQVMAAEPTLRFLPLSDGKQPLFMWILMFLVSRFSDPLWIGRALSAVFGLGSMIGIGAVSFLLFKNKKAALVSVFLWALSPFSVFFERMALVDASLAFWSVITLMFAVLMAQARRIDTAIMTGIALGFASLTKSPALFVALLLPSVWLLSFPDKKNKILRFLVQASGLTLISYLFAFAMYNIQRLGPNFHLLGSRTADYVFSISHLWQSPLDPFLPHLDRALSWIFMMGPGALVLLILFSLFTAPQKFIKQKILLLIWCLLPFVVQAMFAKVFTARYILFALPPLFVLAGVWIFGNKKYMRVGLLLLSLFVLQSLSFNYNLLTNPEAANLPRSERSGYLEEWTAGTGIKEAAQIIKEVHKQNPEKQIVVGTEGYFGTLPDGMQVYLQGTPNTVVIGTGLNFEKVPQQLIQSASSGNLTYFAVNSSRLQENFVRDNLELVVKFEKAKRPKDTHGYIQHGPFDVFYLFKVIADE